MHLYLLLQLGNETYAIFFGFALFQVGLDVVDAITEFLDGSQILTENFGHIFALKALKLDFKPKFHVQNQPYLGLRYISKHLCTTFHVLKRIDPCTTK